MATVHVAAGQDDVSYSHTLNKLLRVNVEKNPGAGDGSRQLNRAFGQTGISRASVVSRYDQSAAADALLTPQGRGPGSPAGPPSRGGPQKPASPGGTAAPGTNSKTTRRLTYHTQPEPPASFMRTAFSAPVTQRRRQRRSFTSDSPPGSSGGGGGSGAAAAPPVGKEKSALTAAAHLLVPPVRRVASVSGGLLAAAAAAGAMFGEDAAGSGGGQGLAANPHHLSPRIRIQNGGVSNLSYKPPANVTAEPAAAVLQRRRAAFQAARTGGVGSPVGGSNGGGAFLFAGGAAAVAAAAVAAAGGGNSSNLLRASWGSPPTSQGVSGPLSMQLLSLGLGSSTELESGVKVTDGDDGAAGSGAAGGALGPFAAAFGGEAGGPGGSDAYDSIWPLSAGWRTLGPGADSDPDGVRTSAEVHGVDSAGMGLYIRPATSPVLASLLRRSGGAPGGDGGGGGGTAVGTPTSGARPSPFAPPMQLYYMKSGEDEDDGPGGPVATVATAAAKAGRSPPSPTPSSAAERISTRIPNLDLALLRPSISAPTGGAGGGGGSGGGDTGSGGGTGTGMGAATGMPGSGPGNGGAARPSQLVKCDSDLGQDCHEEGAEDEEDAPAGAAGGVPPPAPAAGPVPAPAPAAPATRTSGDALKPYSLRTAPSNPVTPMGGAPNMFKAQAADKAAGAAAGSGAADKAAAGPGASGTTPAGAAAAATGTMPAEASGGDADAAARKRRSSARGANASLDGEPSTGATGVYVMGDTTKMLQVGVSVAALMEIVKALPPTSRFATTSEIFDQWLEPPTRNSQCRFLDLVMARVKIILGDQPEGGVQLTPAGSRGLASGMPVLHPDRTWFGPPDHYVIHSWSGNFQALVSALREYCVAINKTPSSTYVWLDVMAANHHPGRKDKKELPHCRQIMATARKALLVLDPMAITLTRLWCLYEIWLAACAVPGASPSKLTLLNGGADWDAFADSFFRIDLSRCATSSPDDRARLLEDMIRTSHDSGSGFGSQPASGTTISPYGVVAALPQLSAAVRAALFDAAASDIWEARKGAKAGGNGMLALLDAVERYAMIRRLAGGHVEAEEQLETAVAVAMGVSGGRVPNSARPMSPGTKGPAPVSGGGAAAGGGSTEAGGEVTASGGIGGVAVKADPTAAWGTDPGGAASQPGGASAGATDLGFGGGGGGGGGGGLEPPLPPVLSLPPIYPTRYSTTTLTSSNPINRAISPAFGAASINGRLSVEPEDDFLATAAATAAAAAAAAAAVTANANGGNALSNAAAWRKKPATLAALALLQAEHGRLIQASTHAAMALSCVPGLALMRPAVPAGPEKDTDGDELYDYGGGGGAAGGGGGGGGGGRNLRSARDHQSFHSTRQRSGSPPMQHYQSIRSRNVTYDNGGGGGGMELDRRSYGGQRGGGGGGGGGGRDGRDKEPSSPPPAPGEIAWKGSYWELTSPQNITTDATRAIFMASMVEAACGRHEAAAQLALQAGHARAAALGPAHPATLATRKAAVPHLLALGRVVEAQILARSLLREAVAEHGEVHPSVGICHGAVAMVLAAQNKAEQAYSSAQRGAEVLASSLGRGHPATLDALQLCADMLESAREFGKAVALMRLVVQGRSAPGAIRASPASPAFLAPNNRLLHLRTIAALEEKAVSEEHSRRAMIGVMRNLARLESELRAALMAMTGAAKQTQMLIQRDLELVLMAQNKRYEAAMLRKGELRPA